MHPGGRPPGSGSGIARLTPAVADAIVAGVSAGIPLDSVAASIGVARDTLSTWLALADGRQQDWRGEGELSDAARDQIAALSARLARAHAEFETRMVQAITDAVGVVGKSGVPEWRAALELLRHHPGYAERWRDRRDVQVQQRVDISVTRRWVRELPEPDRLALLPPELRELVEQTTPPQLPTPGTDPVE